jgi:hypothetical protein
MLLGKAFLRIAALACASIGRRAVQCRRARGAIAD